MGINHDVHANAVHLGMGNHHKWLLLALLTVMSSLGWSFAVRPRSHGHTAAYTCVRAMFAFTGMFPASPCSLIHLNWDAATWTKLLLPIWICWFGAQPQTHTACIKGCASAPTWLSIFPIETLSVTHTLHSYVPLLSPLRNPSLEITCSRKMQASCRRAALLKNNKG